MGAWEVLTGMVTFLMWEYNRGMVKVGKTGGTGWTGEEEGIKDKTSRSRLCISEKVIIINDGSRKKRLQGGEYENTYTLR